MATGDMKNNIKQLQTELKAVKFSQSINIDGLVGGSPQTYLGIYHYMFTTYSTKFNKDISNSNNELYGKSDMRFMEAVYKILRDMFDHKPQITREQFFSPGFAERKVIMTTDILRLIRSRYKPPKSSTFKVAATKEEPKASPREKILKEPHERPRKIAHKSPPNVAGAIVLPVRSASAGNGYKIPKSSFSGSSLPFEVPLFEATVSGKSKKNKQPHESEADDVEVVVVRATSPDQSIAEPVNNRQTFGDQESRDVFVRRKVVDLVSPALMKINERLGKLEIGIQDLEKAEKSMAVSEVPSSAALTAGLSKQMNDVIFKLETLSSRVILLENRMMMVEARLDDEENYRKVLSSSQNYLSARSAAGRSTVPSVSKGYIPENDEDKNTGSDKVRFTPALESKDKDVKSASDVRVSEKGQGSSQSDKNDDVVEVTNENAAEDDRVEVEGVGTEKGDNMPSAREEKMAFIKTLVNPNDTENSAIANIGQTETQDKEDEQIHQQSDNVMTTYTQSMTPSSQVMTATATPFDDLISPIRSFSGVPYFSHYQDESVLSIPYGKYDLDASEDRRSSTPTHRALDTSTLSRVNRINQMLAETQQLFD